MGKLGEFFITLGDGTIFLAVLLVGVAIAWSIQRTYPRLSRWLAWLSAIAGIVISQYSLSAGLCLAILGALFMALCDIQKQSP